MSACKALGPEFESRSGDFSKIKKCLFKESRDAVRMGVIDAMIEELDREEVLVCEDRLTEFLTKEDYYTQIN